MTAEISWISPIQLLASSVTSAKYECGPEPRSIESTEVNLTVSTTFGDIEDDGDFAICRSTIDADYVLKDEDDADIVYLDAACTLKAVVGIQKSVIDESMSDIELRDVLEMNAFSLGYGEVRSFLRDLACRAGMKKVTLPAVNAVEYMKLVNESRANTEG